MKMEQIFNKSLLNKIDAQTETASDEKVVKQIRFEGCTTSLNSIKNFMLQLNSKTQPQPLRLRCYNFIIQNSHQDPFNPNFENGFKHLQCGCCQFYNLKFSVDDLEVYCNEVHHSDCRDVA